MTLGEDTSIVADTLIGLTRYLTSTNSVKFTASDIKALLNSNMYNFTNELIRAGSDIDFNLTTESIDIVNGTAEYSITGKVLRIKKMNITYDGSKPHKNVTFFDIGQSNQPLDSTSISSNFNTADPFADLYLDDETLKVKLYPVPTTDITGGLIVWKILEPTILSTTDQEPSIPEAYQPYLVYGACKTYYIKKGLTQKAREMDALMVDMLEKAKRHYQSIDENIIYNLNSDKRFNQYK